MGWRGKNGCQLGCVRVLHRGRTHNWLCRGSCRCHDIIVRHWGVLTHSLKKHDVAHGGHVGVGMRCGNDVKGHRNGLV